MGGVEQEHDVLASGRIFNTNRIRMKCLVTTGSPIRLIEQERMKSLSTIGFSIRAAERENWRVINPIKHLGRIMNRGW